MTPELKWLALTSLLTSLLWIPYVLNLIMVRGLLGATGYPENPKPLAGWAARLKNAHYNAIENLVVFGLLVVVAHLAGIHTNSTAAACMVYFWARLTHAIVYAAGIPVVRTLAFAVSWACNLVFASALLL